MARDANVIRKLGERALIISEMERLNPAVVRWVLELPRVRYDFRTGDVALGRETIDYVITEAQNGQFCLADASDRVLQTAYYLIRGIVDLNTEQAFNDYIARITGVRNQPPFQPGHTERTHHTDPYHQLREEE